MNLTKQIAKQLRDLHFGGNWTWSNLKEHLADVAWKEATTQVYNLNTIATLVYHMNYYLNVVSNRVQQKPFDYQHELSFELPPIQSQQDWERLIDKTWTDVETFAKHIEDMPENMLWEEISDEYGNYFRNIVGVIEHNHYHLGQIVVIKKIISQAN
jgi:hypothetical protein